ncbi:MAG TPA: hypothetical protein ENH60_03025 [Pricia sp.]|nr:hypothetical protein [Pricia sp.]
MSTRRFIGIEKAQLLAMIDLDAALYVEYDDNSKEPIALIETAIDVNKPKPATVTRNLAIRAKPPAFVVLYTLSDIPNPADSQWKDILKFRVKRLNSKAEKGWESISPEEWAKRLLKMREWSAGNLDRENI